MTGTKTVITAGTLATALMFGGIFLYLNFASIAKNLTEKIATQALGVQVAISGMEVSLPEKQVKVRGVRVANPKGYKEPYALTLGSIDISLSEISEGLIGFNEISVSDAAVNVEVTEHGTNLNDIRNYAQANRAEKPAEAQRKVIIKSFKLGQTTINPAVTLVERELSPITMPPLEMKGIGERENGILAREAIVQIWTHVSQKVSTKAAQQGVLDGLSSDQLKEVGASGLDNFKNQLGEELDGLGDSLKGVFGD